MTGMLRERIDLLVPTDASNGAGGRTRTFNVVATVAGSATAPTRDYFEKDEGGAPKVQEQIELVLDASAVTVTGKMRARTADGKVYELVSLTQQDGYAFARGRRVP